MLDDNLPTFFLKNNSQTPQQSTIFHRQHGNEVEPAYTLKYLDPAAQTSQNRYGVALYDPYVPDIVYGEVAVTPEWTQPSLSADTIRANGGAAPPPEPILPTEFSIQLYNPDQQIVIRHKPKTWNKPARWEFEMPQRSFRVPSSSTLDRTQSDPAAAEVTPKLRFSWRKDGKLSKDLSCLLHGKSTTIAETKNKSREPDITVAIFQGLKELTLYEPNLYRVEMEDFKGLEVVLLLAAVAIRDIFFGPAKEAFHIVPGAVPTAQNGKPQAAAATGRKTPNPQPQAPAQATGATPARKPDPRRHSIMNPQSPGPQVRRQQDELAAQEERRTQELLAAEQREQETARRRKEAELESETKRLQEIYGQEEQRVRMQQPRPHPDTSPTSRPNLPLRHSGPEAPYNSHRYSQSQAFLGAQAPTQPPRHTRPQSYYPQANPAPTFANSPYLQNPAHLDPRSQSTVSFGPPRPQATGAGAPNRVPVSNGALAPGQAPRPQLQPKKSSFFGLRRNKEEARAPNKLDKKRSSMF
ncbi:hypothetical protein N7466_007126 [Penicillium verhagenii]|uniref:uncharacterized protein n=1 Tax=Penicillium verhagenii TaxID=1562060 RepID=UPI002544FEA5|nr:uncharacterized protein N7466_007126 [Penicillium verhagenii]KAJ5928170.1 hypothetical protein N7466_007126 [Penicillium verhagenii]